MKTVTMHEAKTHLSQLVELALAGEEIVIARRKEPLVRLVVVRKDKSKRKVGGLPGLVARMGDDFNAPMEDWGAGFPEPGAK
jgi:prevent-host-death family protein